MSDKEMSRGDTMLISIDAPTEYPVTTLQDVVSTGTFGYIDLEGNVHDA